MLGRIWVWLAWTVAISLIGCAVNHLAGWWGFLPGLAIVLTLAGTRCPLGGLVP